MPDPSAEPGSGPERVGADLTGWGRTAPTRSELLAPTTSAAAAIRAAGPRGVLARGLGRSYGDAAQNSGGLVLPPGKQAIAVDAARGTVRVSAGTSLHALVRQLLPRGLFVPVTPGTRYVTVGGAIACDIHGKNHHRVGSLGEHLRSLDLVGPDGRTRTLRPDSPDFWSTVGGMGLTGIITAAELAVVPVPSPMMSVDTERVADLGTLMQRMRESDGDHTYSVAWIDTLARGRALGRSVLTRGEHATPDQVAASGAESPGAGLPADPRVRAPRWAPPWLISRPTVRVFNEAWFRKAPTLRRGEVTDVATFFHPLDGVADWNRLYGTRGFVQYQLVVPDAAEQAMPEILELLARTGHPSFLAVLKRFGPGNAAPLSFPIAGWTLALDLPVHPGLWRLFADLDRIVLAAGGRVYLAKDSRLDAATLERMYPRLDEFRAALARLDPDRVFRSDLARRLAL